MQWLDLVSGTILVVISFSLVQFEGGKRVQEPGYISKIDERESDNGTVLSITNMSVANRN